MNEAYHRFVLLSKQQREDVFEAAAEGLDTRSTYIEKDFWVSLILDIFYNGLSQQPLESISAFSSSRFLESWDRDRP